MDCRFRGASLPWSAFAAVVLVVVVVVASVACAFHIVLNPSSRLLPPYPEMLKGEDECFNSTDNLPGGAIVPFGCNTVAGNVYRRTRSGLW